MLGALGALIRKDERTLFNKHTYDILISIVIIYALHILYIVMDYMFLHQNYYKKWKKNLLKN